MNSADVQYDHPCSPEIHYGKESILRPIIFKLISNLTSELLQGSLLISWLVRIPASISLAATFDLELAYKVGKALAEETLTKGANVL
jgi:hypothetical protein